jgi:hypothetical protein
MLLLASKPRKHMPAIAAKKTPPATLPFASTTRRLLRQSVQGFVENPLVALVQDSLHIYI